MFMYLYIRNCITEGVPTDITAASRVGKIEGQNVWVLSQNCQINHRGDLIAEENQTVKWISNLYKAKRNSQDPVWVDIAKPDHECAIKMPLSSEGLKTLVAAIKNAFGGNWLSSIFLLGNIVIKLHNNYNSVCTNKFKCYKNITIKNCEGFPFCSCNACTPTNIRIIITIINISTFPFCI